MYGYQISLSKVGNFYFSANTDLALMRRIDELHLEFPFMGARALRDQLVRAGFRVGRKHVGSLMARMGIAALYRKPGTSKKHPGHKVYPYLLRGLLIERSNQVWALDTTYIPMAKGFVYLTTVWIGPAARSWRRRSRLRWRHVMPSVSFKMLSTVMARRKS